MLLKHFTWKRVFSYIYYYYDYDDDYNYYYYYYYYYYYDYYRKALMKEFWQNQF